MSSQVTHLRRESGNWHQEHLTSLIEDHLKRSESKRLELVTVNTHLWPDGSADVYFYWRKL